MKYKIVNKIIIIFFLGLTSRFLINNYYDINFFIPLEMIFIDILFTNNELIPLNYINSIEKNTLSNINARSINDKCENILKKSVAHSNKCHNVDNSIIDRCRRKFY
jgi:hypothetical protein